MSKYKIVTTKDFEEELEKIYNYFLYFLKEPKIAKKLYNQIINSVTSLEFFPKKYYQIQEYSKLKNKDIRKMTIKKYVIIYEVNDTFRSSNYFTYIPPEVKII